MTKLVSIIICTRNRAEDLRRTLESLARVKVPANLEAELVLADNGSEDDTRRVAEAFEAPHLPVRYLFEPRPEGAGAELRASTCARGRSPVHR